MYSMPCGADETPDKTPIGGEAERILSAARDLLSQTGYQSLKIQTVARRADVSIGALYRNFADKDELIAALVRKELALKTPDLEAATAKGTPEDRVRAWINAVVGLAFGADEPRARWFTTLPPRAIRIAVENLPPEGNPLRPLEHAIEDGKATGRFPAARPSADAHLIQGLCGHLDRSGAAWLAPTREEAVALVADFLLAALTNPDREGPHTWAVPEHGARSQIEG